MRHTGKPLKKLGGKTAGSILKTAQVGVMVMGRPEILVKLPTGQDGIVYSAKDYAVFMTEQDDLVHMEMSNRAMSTLYELENELIKVRLTSAK